MQQAGSTPRFIGGGSSGGRGASPVIWQRFIERVAKDPERVAVLVRVLACWRCGLSAVVLRDSMTPQQVADLGRAFPNARRLFLYGMTEAGPRLSHLAFEEGGGVDGCVGIPYSHVEWRLDPVAGSDAGRLVLRGPGMFLGYITAAGGYEGLDEAGCFQSNDLLNRDAAGRLHFRGRIDRIFRSGGRLVNPDAIERVLTSQPSIEDAVCQAEPHSILGLVPVAEVVLRRGATFDPTALMAACATQIEPHAVPRRIVQTDAGGLAESGKRRRPKNSGPQT